MSLNENTKKDIGWWCIQFGMCLYFFLLVTMRPYYVFKIGDFTAVLIVIFFHGYLIVNEINKENK